MLYEDGRELSAHAPRYYPDPMLMGIQKEKKDWWGMPPGNWHGFHCGYSTTKGSPVSNHEVTVPFKQAGTLNVSKNRYYFARLQKTMKGRMWWFVNDGKRCREKIWVRVCRLCPSTLEIREKICVKMRKVIRPLTVFASILVECRKMLRLTVFHRQLSTVPASEFRRLGAYLLISGLLECAIR